MNARCTQIAIAATDGHWRELCKEREWFLKQIKRKRKERDNFIDDLTTIKSELASETSHIVEEFRRIEDVVHDHFDRIVELCTSRYAKMNVVAFYETLVDSGLLTERDHEWERMSSFQFMMAQALGLELDWFESDPAEFADEMEGRGRANGPAGAGANGSAGDHTPFSLDSATRPRHSEFHKLYLKLARRFHPDHCATAEAQAHNAEIMREINRAYNAEDFARLVELDQITPFPDTSSAKSQGNDLQSACERMKIELEQLARQYESIKQELRELRSDRNVKELVQAYRRSRQEKERILGEFVQQFEFELRQINKVHDLLKGVIDGEVEVEEIRDFPDHAPYYFGFA